MQYVQSAILVWNTHMKMHAEIFSQGEEVVNGQTLDTNATWLAQQLNDLGFRVKETATVGDQLADLVEVFSEISKRADCCICTGGLGPTSDDLTAEALSLATGQRLIFDEDAFAAIASYFARRNRTMPETNRKQAFLPENAVRIANPVGTAPGFSLKFGRCLFICLPGVPAEMKTMFDQSVLSQLSQTFVFESDRLITLRSVGIGESAIQHQLKEFILPDDVELGYRAALGEVQIKLRFPGTYSDSDVSELSLQIKQMLGDVVYSIDGIDDSSGDLLAVIDREMQKQQQQLILVESISYGVIAHRCFGYPWLKHAILEPHESMVACSNYADISLIRKQFPKAIILRQSCPNSIAEMSEMQQAVRLKLNLTCPSNDYQKEVVLAGSLDYKQQQAAVYTLDFLRRYLFNLCL